MASLMRPEILVEQKHDIVGEPVLGKLREAAQVAEQDGDLLLDAPEDTCRCGTLNDAASPAGSSVVIVRSAAGRSWQAEPDIGRSADPLQHRRFGIAGGGLVRQTLDHPDPAGRAARAAAAHRGMRDVVEAADLEKASGLAAPRPSAPPV